MKLYDEKLFGYYWEPTDPTNHLEPVLNNNPGPSLGWKITPLFTDIKDEEPFGYYWSPIDGSLNIKGVLSDDPGPSQGWKITPLYINKNKSKMTNIDNSFLMQTYMIHSVLQWGKQFTGEK